MPTTTHYNKSQEVKLDYIEAKQEKERKISMEISHKDRLGARDALVHCRNIKQQPLNVLVSFEFQQDAEHPSYDILKIRSLAHQLRMICQRDDEFDERGRESLMIWTRKTVPGSGIEQCYIITFCPDDKLVSFTKQILGWKGFPRLAVEPVDPEKADRLRNGRYVSLFEEMFAQNDHWSRHLIKGVYSEAGGALRGPRVFYSLKLGKSKLIKHRRDTAAAVLAAKLAGSNLSNSSGTV